MSHAKMKRRRTCNTNQNHEQITVTGAAKTHTQTQLDKWEQMCIAAVLVNSSKDDYRVQFMEPRRRPGAKAARWDSSQGAG